MATGILVFPFCCVHFVGSLEFDTDVLRLRPPLGPLKKSRFVGKAIWFGLSLWMRRL